MTDVDELKEKEEMKQNIHHRARRNREIEK
jgi:hypothetical protein